MCHLRGNTTRADASSPPSDDSLIDLSPLVFAWSRVCEVAADIKSEKVQVLSALRAVNSFRNRLAHVPFPYDSMRDIAENLRACTEQLFRAQPSPTSGSGPFAGAIAYRKCLIQGSTTNVYEIYEADGPFFVFRPGRGQTGECWFARPFIFIDGMFRPYVLTRVKKEAADWEYTRYLAEATRNMEPARATVSRAPADPVREGI